MELIVLMVIIAVVKAALDSQKAKAQSQSRQEQQERQGQPAKPSETAPSRPVQAERSKQEQSGQTLIGQITDMLKEALGGETPAETSPAHTKPKPAAAKSKSGSGKGKAAGQKGAAHQKPKAAGAKARANTQGRHEKLTPNVKPVKSVFEQQDDCGHRIELNPHINYSAKQEAKANTAAIQVAQDTNAVLQGVIWAEILGKPKAFKRR